MHGEGGGGQRGAAEGLCSQRMTSGSNMWARTREGVGGTNEHSPNHATVPGDMRSSPSSEKSVKEGASNES